MLRSTVIAEDLRFGMFDPEQEAGIVAKWTHDPDIMLTLTRSLPRPLSAAQIKKQYENLEKLSGEGNQLYSFALRTLSENRLVGFVRISHIDWSNSNGVLKLGIGDPADRGRGLGSQALGLALHYAFGELNLHRLTAGFPACQTRLVNFFERAGFAREYCRREAFFHQGRRWDMYGYGILRSEWKALQSEISLERSR